MDHIKEDRTFTIGQASDLLGIKQFNLRFYEKELGIIIPRTKSGRRYYTLSEISLFKKIKKFRDDDKLHLEGIKQQLVKNGLLVDDNSEMLPQKKFQASSLNSNSIYSKVETKLVLSPSRQGLKPSAHTETILDELYAIQKLLQSDN